MTAPGGGGDRLEVPVVADAAGFSKGLQAKIDAQTKAIRARIRAEIDTKRLQAQAAAAARLTEKNTKISLKVGVDARYLKESIKAALAGITGNEYKIKVGVDVDTGRVQRAMDDATRSGRSTEVEVDADTAQARESVENFRREQKRRPVEAPITPKVDAQAARQAQRALMSLGKFGLMAGGVQLLTSAVTALGGGLIAVVGAASQAVAALAVLPNLGGMALQGIGALVAGFSGIGDAVGAMGTAASGGGGGAGAAAATAKAQEQAQRRIADARQRVADVYESSARSIQRAERSLADSQKAAQRAQESLTKARRDATERLEDYKLSVAGAALDEEAATLAVERARERWNETMRSPVSTTLDRAEADLALRQAEHSLEAIKESNADLFAEASSAAQAGVEGSAEVLAATADIADANQEVADAEAELALTRRDATRDLADAQRDLADAIAEASEAGGAAGGAGGGVDLLAQAMAKLSPAGRAFAEFIQNKLKPRIQDFRNAIQQELLPDIQATIDKLITTPPGGQSFLDVVQKGMVGTADELGKIAVKAGDLMASDLFKGNTATIMESNNRALSSFGDTGINMMAILSDIAVAVGPLVERFAKWTATLTEGWRESARTNSENGKMAAFFERAGDRAAQLGRIVGNLASILFSLGKAGTETGDGLLKKFEDLTEKWRTWANSDAGQKRLTGFFEQMGPLFEKLGETAANVGELIVAMGESGGGSLGGFLTVVNGLLTALTAIFQSPLGPFVSAFLSLAGAAGAIGMIGGAVGKAAGNIKTVVGYYGGLKDFAWGLKDGATAAEGLGTKAAEAGAKVKDIGTKMVTAATDVASSAASMARSAATSVAAAGRKAAAWVTAAATTAAAWVTMAVSATVNAIAIAVTWTVQTAITTATLIAGWAVAGATIVAGWVLMGAQSLLNAARMAAAWLIAMGPIGLIIAGIIAFAAVIWANWDNIKRWTVEAFDKVVGAVRTAIDWVKNNWPLLLAILTGPIGLAVLWIVNHWEQIKSSFRSVMDSLAGLARGALNAVLRVLNGTIIAGINVVISGANKVNPFSDIPKVPSIPLLAEGAIVRRPTLAMIGEDGDEAVIPLSASRTKRRDELLAQAGLSAAAVSTPADAAALGGWGSLDAISTSRPLASQVASSAAAVHDAAPRTGAAGTVIEEGAITQVIHNPVPETPTETLNARLRRLASVGIFDSKP